jgi:hypothetical protein
VVLELVRRGKRDCLPRCKICKINFEGSFIHPSNLIFAFVLEAMPKTRSANARPDREERLENAALRSRVKSSYEKAQQEEALKELLKIMGANGGKLAYGDMDKLVKNIKKMVLKP